jgi:two-component system, chemotaxis family, response regulator PixG
MQPGSPSFGSIAEKLAVLSQQKATGELILSSGDHQWHLYLFLGRLLYATGGVHRVRRWHRAVMQDCPGMKFDPRDVEDELWEYYQMERGISQNHLTLTQAKSIISKIVHEVLFTLVRYSNLKSLWLPKKVRPIALIEVKQSLQAALDLRKEWQNKGLGKLSLDTAPIFRQPISEQNLTTSKTFFSLSLLVNGDNTIWDITLQMKQSVITVASLIQSLTNEGILELLTVPDLPTSVVATTSSSTRKHIQSYAALGETSLTPSSQSLLNSVTQLMELPSIEESSFVDLVPVTQPQSTFDSSPVNVVQPEASSLIAYIDDSHSDRLIMGKILAQAGYQFLNVQDPVTALPMLLEYKPSLIFLDLVMPIANGYEICTQIRRVSAFKNTPVIILTGNDGIVDRVRAKMVGSSGFLAKPITAEKILKILHRHLPSSLPIQVESLQIAKA